MIIKDILFKIKEDLKRLNFYPEAHFGDDGKVNYDLYWQKRRKGKESSLTSWQKQRADHIISIIENDVRVLDIGCGDGAILKYMMQAKQIVGIGADMSESELLKAKQQGIETYKIDLRNDHDILSLPMVDYVLGLEILEHMAEPEHIIKMLSSKINKSMIFSFPNSGYYLHRLRFLFGKFPLQWIVHPGEHLRFWTVGDVYFWVEQLGFKLDKLILYEGLPILNKIFPRLFGQGIIIQISKK